LIVLPPVRATAAATLLTVTRADIRLVSIGGRPIVASPELRTIFSARRVPRSRLVVDDVEKAVDARLARAIEGCPIEERGVVGPSVPRTAACV
jgi:hypothetical protein